MAKHSCQDFPLQVYLTSSPSYWGQVLASSPILGISPPKLLPSLQSTLSISVLIPASSFSITALPAPKRYLIHGSEGGILRRSKGKQTNRQMFVSEKMAYLLQHVFEQIYTFWPCFNLLKHNTTMLPKWPPTVWLFKNQKYNLPHYLKQRADPGLRHLQWSEAPWKKNRIKM